MGDQFIAEKFASFQEYLDNYVYCNERLKIYDKIFGHMYCSPGGEKTTEEFCKLLHLQKGQRVLDVCCGMGGASFDLVRKFGVRVLGVDLSQNMLDIAHTLRKELNMENDVTFQHADVTKVDFDEASFDAIISRDSFLHLKEKQEVLKKCLRWLKPGGQMLFSDYICPSEQWTQEYSDYVATYGYYVITMEDYANMLTEAGFVNVQAMDKTTAFAQILKDELQTIAKKKEEFFKDGMSKAEYDETVTVWEQKLRRAQRGEQRWGWFLVEKASMKEQP